MFTHAVLLAVVLAADAPDGAFDNPRELRAAVRDALRREATTKGAKHDQAVRDLTELYQQLRQDQQLPEPERKQRLGQIRYRLKDLAELLERHTGAKSSRDMSPANDVLGQAMAAPFNGGAATRAAGSPAGAQAGTLPGESENAEQLMELIENTIAPDSWEARGGPGTMMYFPPSKVLVIRQTGEVHGQVRDLSNQLRK
jgi:general secretion pathway protein D